MKLVFVLPTCEPYTMEAKLLPSVKYMLPIKDLVEFCICFQPPYTKEQVEQTLKGFEGLNVKWIYKQYNFQRPFTPLMEMRNDCAMLEPDADYYALLDDDMQFQEHIDEFYKDAIKSFDEDPNLGVVAFTDTYKNVENYFYTNRGLIYRGGKYYGFKGLIPHKLLPNTVTRIEYEGEDLLELYGGHQDKFSAMIRLATGQTTKQYNHVPTLHNEIREIKGAYEHGWIEAETHDKSIVSFIRKYFREDYDFEHGRKCWDLKIKNQLLGIWKPSIYTLPKEQSNLIIESKEINSLCFNINFDFSMRKFNSKEILDIMKFYDSNNNEIFKIGINACKVFMHNDGNYKLEENKEFELNWFRTGKLYPIHISIIGKELYINGARLQLDYNNQIARYEIGMFNSKYEEENIMEIYNNTLKREKNILIIGHGIVGKLEEETLSKLNPSIYDINENFEGDLNNHYDLAVVCVPTETIDNKCDISQVEDAITKHSADIYLIKSTVAVGTCRALSKKYGKRIVFSPEHSGSTQHCTNFEYKFTVLGGEKEDCFAVQQIYQEVYDAYHTFRIVDFETAELAKYMENAYLGMKVRFCKEFYNVCEQLGIPYEELRECFVLDPRIEDSHTYIYKEHPYYDSHCLNKDIPVIAYQFDMPLLKKIIEENDKDKKEQE